MRYTLTTLIRRASSGDASALSLLESWQHKLLLHAKYLNALQCSIEMPCDQAHGNDDEFSMDDERYAYSGFIIYISDNNDDSRSS